jgi:hypothetical protein
MTDNCKHCKKVGEYYLCYDCDLFFESGKIIYCDGCSLFFLNEVMYECIDCKKKNVCGSCVIQWGVCGDCASIMLKNKT